MTGLSWSPDGTQLATACDDRTVRVFNLADPTAKSIPFRRKELRVGVQDVAFGDDNSHVAVQVGASAPLWKVPGRGAPVPLRMRFVMGGAGRLRWLAHVIGQARCPRLARLLLPCSSPPRLEQDRPAEVLHSAFPPSSL